MRRDCLNWADREMVELFGVLEERQFVVQAERTAEEIGVLAFDYVLTLLRHVPGLYGQHLDGGTVEAFLVAVAHRLFYYNQGQGRWEGVCRNERCGRISCYKWSEL